MAKAKKQRPAVNIFEAVQILNDSKSEVYGLMAAARRVVEHRDNPKGLEITIRQLADALAAFDEAAYPEGGGTE